MANRKRFSDFIAFLSSIKGDLANITSPPSFLAPESVFYVGADTSTGIKKPLNAFLGELFLGQWRDGIATASTIAEQVSHHPPITACYLANEEHKIWGEGYARVEMTFSGNLNVNQIGHATLHLDEYNEHHLIQWPTARVKGFLSGHLYPELHGTSHIVSSSGFVSEITYSGKGFLSGAKNSFVAKIYQRDDVKKIPLYNVKGCWSDKFYIYDVDTGEQIDVWDPEDHPPSLLEESAPVDQQDPFESRKAWRHVISALKSGDLSLAVSEKSKVEDAQRAIRKADPKYVSEWAPLFFTASNQEDDSVTHMASAIPGWQLNADRTKGVWKFDRVKAKASSKPYHDGLDPTEPMSKRIKAGSIDETTVD